MLIHCPYCESEVSADLRSERKAIVGCSVCLSPYLAVRDGEAWETSKLPGGLDIRRAAPPDSLTGQVLRNLRLAVEEMPILPTVSERILALSRDPDATMNDLAEIIREDTVIAASVLRAANSALYRGLTEITSLTSACARLGLRTLCNIVQTVANERVFRSRDRDIQSWLERLWRHSLVTAYAANEVALQVSEANPDAVYLGGLFHDAGKIALLFAAEQSDEDAREAFEENPKLLTDILERFHGIAGIHVMQHWSLANEFSLSQYYHHAPTECWREDWRRKIHIISLGNAIATASGFGSYGEEGAVSLASHPSSEFLGLSEIRMANLLVELEEKFEPLLEAFTAGAPAR
jgi:HD-like signal output (HDOD) protein